MLKTYSKVLKWIGWTCEMQILEKFFGKATKICQLQMLNMRRECQKRYSNVGRSQGKLKIDWFLSMTSSMTVFQNEPKKSSLRAKRATFTKRHNKKGWISDFNDVTGSQFKFPPFCRDKFKIRPYLLGQNSKFTPFYRVKILKSPLFIGPKSQIYPFLLGQYFVNVARFARKLFWASERYT